MASSTAEIKQLEIKIKEDVKQVNELPKIVKALKNKDKAVAQAAMLSMRRLLVFFAEKGDLKATTTAAPSDAKKQKTDDAVATFRKWLWGIYVSFIKEMLDWLLKGQDENVQVNALRTLMEFISREGELRGHGAPAFGNETFMRVVQQLMANPKLKGEVASVFKGEYVGAYLDVQYYMLRNLTQILDTELEAKKEPTGDFTFVSNALRLLNMVNMPAKAEDISSFLVEVKTSDNNDEEDDDEEEEESEKEDAAAASVGAKRKATDDPKAAKGGLRSLKQHQHVFSMCWVAMLRHQLPQDAYKKILTQLPFEIMPHLENPLLLSDFLTDSYNLGGVTSLLALNGLFILITDHNFDYPDFYNKLYNLIADPTLLSAKQRFRFFGLLELFLSSSHLPAYMVAAFAKRLARISLVAEPGAILFIIPMVYNLILRHKECLQLIHRSGATTASEVAKKRREELSSTNSVDAAAKKLARTTTEIALKDGHDPYLSEEKDPQKCNALQSSLWEIYTMRYHANAEVALKAKMFEEKLRSQFLDLDESMDITYKSMFDQQLKRKAKGRVPLAFKPCTTLFTEEDGFANVFEL
ncbi:hypothetical protein Poli38472_002586 [Pythium oligandrum]|uniref:CCAAT-binding factor domain-containing protein n=1 Tax=Pythium oligandrum TaxID=41045 RepID=A0A8K1FH88_PYTOL|nr:hypothetical protein Poli38472_002586 [Pythium oligandrum]|eukprot:TMW63645.1 hypothetical protein Poli38472_002586 [Pythium oligandrum]